MTLPEPEGRARGRPFEAAAEPDLCYENAPRAATLNRLRSAFARGEPLAVLTGEPGTGKTALLRRLMAELDGAGLTCIVCSLPVGREDLRVLLPAAGPGRRVALALDEAQALGDDLLRGLPALLADRPDVQILLVGEREIEAKLTALGVELLPAVLCRLAPLPTSEVGSYMHHCWQKAGSGPFPFAPSAVARIAGISGGVPQVINLICSRVLWLAETRGRELVSAELVDEVAEDLLLVRRARWVRPGPRAVHVVAVVAVIVPLLIAGAIVLLRPAPPGREARVETSPSPPVSRPSAPPAIAALSPEPVRSEPIAIAPPAPRVERESRPSPLAPVPPLRPPAVRLLFPIGPGSAVKGEALLRHAENGDVEAVRSLLGEGVAPAVRDAAGFTPLMLAVIHGERAIVDLLLTTGRAAVNAQNRAGLTPLMLAAINDKPAILRALMDRGAELNGRTTAGWTALTYAAWRGYPDIVRLLLARGADGHVIDREGWTILEYANWRAAEPATADDLPEALAGADSPRSPGAGRGHAEVVALLRQAGVKR